MKRFALALAFTLAAVGCHSQVPPNPTVYSCPVSTGSAYTLVGSPTGLSYTDSKPAAGVYCYIAQSTIGTQVSVPSNIAGPFTLSGSNSTALSWNAPTSGPAPTAYAISRAPAIQSTILAPSLVNGQLAEVKPAMAVPESAKPAYALLTAPKLTAQVR